MSSVTSHGNSSASSAPSQPQSSTVGTEAQTQHAPAVASMSLGVRHIFGVSSNVNDNLTFTDDESLVYVAGHGLVVYNLMERRQRFLHSTEMNEVITCYTSGSGKRLCAIAQRGDDPVVHVFDLRTFRRKKSFTIPDILSKVQLFAIHKIHSSSPTFIDL